jgi:drug/metabolite transporter (DMT)-like permease
VLGTKVILVAGLIAIVGGDPLSWAVWTAAGLAAGGIILVQWTGLRSVGDESPQAASRVAWSIALALLAAFSFALFDVLVQSWAPAWGPNRMLPVIFWLAALLSLGFLPWFQRNKLSDADVVPLLLLATLLIAVQAFCLVFTVAQFGDAARVNIVYSLRGMWGVILAWLAAKKWGGAEARLSGATFKTRLAGAVLLTAAVILAIAA